MMLWDKLKNKITEWFQLAGNKTVEITKVGRVKIDILALKKELEEKLVELGGRVYHSTINSNTIDLNSDKKIKQLIEQIKELEVELNNYEISLREIKNKKHN